MLSYHILFKASIVAVQHCKARNQHLLSSVMLFIKCSVMTVMLFCESTGKRTGKCVSVSKERGTLGSRGGKEGSLGMSPTPKDGGAGGTT